MNILVHTDPLGDRAYGIWWVDPTTGSLADLYTRPGSSEEARGRVIVYGKTDPAIPWDMWFDQLTTRQPVFENWQVFDSMGMRPSQFLMSLNPIPLAAA